MAFDQCELSFEGQIAGGLGEHAEMHFPGREELLEAPDDWPASLYPGSLNVVVFEEGYPAGFVAPEMGGNGVRELDGGEFAPAFVIPGGLIGGNKLLTPTDPRRGSAQVWRATVRVARDAQAYDCWVVRRIGSGVGKGLAGNVLEMMSDKRLRTELGVGDPDGERVSVTIFEGSSEEV